MTAPLETSSLAREVDALAHQVARAGQEMGLPNIAASADIGSPTPMSGPDGRPYAETLFHWLDADHRYWEDRAFGLRAAFVHTARVCAEPFYFQAGQLASWRPNQALEAINEGGIDSMGVGAAIVAPAYRHAGAIGLVIWATAEPRTDVAEIFAARAQALHALALTFTAAYGEAHAGAAEAPARLTRREIQCLKWAAAGKTDQEIGAIVHISLPTVRFHITNASHKLQVAGRSQAIHRAAVLGYIGAERPGRP